MTTPPTLDGPRIAPAAGGAPHSLVILLHGYGSNGDDLISLAPYWRDALPHTAFVSPNAPERCPGAPGGYQWWGITNLDPDARKAGAAGAAPALNAFIDAELARTGLTEAGPRPRRVQSRHDDVAPRRPDACNGIGRHRRLLRNAGGRSRPLDAGIAAADPPDPGDADPMIPVSAFHQAKSALEGAGFIVESHVSPGVAHSIDMPGLQLGGRFLHRVLGVGDKPR